MAILLLNNHPLPTENEVEVFSEEGFTVDIIYGPLAKERKPERIENVTEVHWLFCDHEGNHDSVAIESDIDSCGRTINTDWIQCLSITGNVLVN